jgi:hypothetical protein
MNKRVAKHFFRLVLSFGFVILCGDFVSAQESEKPLTRLTDLLQHWYDSLGQQYSGKDELLNDCLLPDINLDKALPNNIENLISPCKLTSKRVGDVLVIHKRTVLNLLDGTVKDSVTGKPIAFATIQFGNSGTITDEEGYFLISSDETEVKLSLSHIGYEPQSLAVSSAQEAIILMNPKNIELAEVRVDGAGSNQNSRKSNENLLREVRTVDAGFYRSLQDALEDSSFKTVSAPLVPNFRTHGVIYHRIKLPKEERKSIGKVFGFSDGKFTYINPRAPKPRKLADFYKTDRIGPYLYFKKEVRISSQGRKITWLQERLLDTNTGEDFTLTRGRLRELIEDDTELLELFNAEKGKSGKLKLYLIEYLRRKSER